MFLQKYNAIGLIQFLRIMTWTRFKSKRCLYKYAYFLRILIYELTEGTANYSFKILLLKYCTSWSNTLLGKKVHEISHLSEFIMRYPTGIKHTYITLYLSIGVLPQTKETVSAVSYYELLLLNPFSHLKSLYFE